jgi:hypothetical protein
MLFLTQAGHPVKSQRFVRSATRDANMPPIHRRVLTVPFSKGTMNTSQHAIGQSKTPVLAAKNIPELR